VDDRRLRPTKTERLVEEHELKGVTVEKLREIFDSPPDAPMVDSFRVYETQAKELQLDLGTPLQFAPVARTFLSAFDRVVRP